MRRRLRAMLGDTKGATAVEFALVIGPLVLVLFGIIEFGRMIWTNNALQETAIDAARCAGILESSCASGGAYSSANTATYAQTVAQGWGIAVPTSAVTSTASTTCAGVAGFSQVTINYTFQTVVPMVLTSMSGGVPLTATACFPKQS
ncbi:MAG TPA: TadE/TadG family type IV pilus assembly protein [Caulobacteraceae bacterium]